MIKSFAVVNDKIITSNMSSERVFIETLFVHKNMKTSHALHGAAVTCTRSVRSATTVAKPACSCIQLQQVAAIDTTTLMTDHQPLQYVWQPLTLTICFQRVTVWVRACVGVFFRKYIDYKSRKIWEWGEIRTHFYGSNWSILFIVVYKSAKFQGFCSLDVTIQLLVRQI